MKKADAIVALGGGISREGALSHSSLTRIDMAVDLHKQGIADLIVTAGRWSHRLQVVPVISEAAAMKERAIKRAVSEEALLLEELSKDTIGNAYFIKRGILSPLGLHKIAVVTCGSYVERTQLVFDQVLGPDYEVSIYPTNEFATSDINKQEVQRNEALGYIALKDKLEGVEPGDDQEFARRFSYLNAHALAS